MAGDSDSSKACLTKDNATANTPVTATSKPRDHGLAQIPQYVHVKILRPPDGLKILHREVIIGCAAGGAVILIIAISMIVFVVRDRKLRRRRTILSILSKHSQTMPPFKPSKAEFTPRNTLELEATPRSQQPPNPFEESPTVESGGNGGGYITNPPYVMREMEGANDDKPPLARRSFSSWTNDDEASK